MAVLCLMPLPKPASQPKKSKIAGKGRMSTYSVEKLVSEAHTILEVNTELAENPQ